MPYRPPTYAHAARAATSIGADVPTRVTADDGSAVCPVADRPVEIIPIPGTVEVNGTLVDVE
jgi:hypothetical protein